MSEQTFAVPCIPPFRSHKMNQERRCKRCGIHMDSLRFYQDTKSLWEPWSDQPPTTAGHYEIRCDETDYQPARVYVYDFKGELWVEDEHIGKNPLNHYHSNLINLQWRPDIRLTLPSLKGNG